LSASDPGSDSSRGPERIDALRAWMLAWAKSPALINSSQLPPAWFVPRPREGELSEPRTGHSALTYTNKS
jgi:hypothetical protein